MNWAQSSPWQLGFHRRAEAALESLLPQLLSAGDQWLVAAAAGALT